MNNDLVFSQAEDANGRIVHIDSVPRGLNCGCRCPYCHERLLARQGEKNEHGFAHHSETRQATLDMCYMVTLYKLAEQIIQERKQILLPSYYGIFPSKEVTFQDVVVDSRFERDDKQLDVIATCADGTRYLIEFTFQYKVQHKQPVDYKNMNCIEIGLSGQTLESLATFLSSAPTSDWRWVNNDQCFSKIEERYTKAGKNIRIASESECSTCDLEKQCCGVREKASHDILQIENNGTKYRLCKPDVFLIKHQEYLEHRRIEEQRLRVQAKGRDENSKNVRREKNECGCNRKRAFANNKSRRNYAEWNVRNVFRDSNHKTLPCVLALTVNAIYNIKTGMAMPTVVVLLDLVSHRKRHPNKQEFVPNTVQM